MRKEKRRPGNSDANDQAEAPRDQAQAPQEDFDPTALERPQADPAPDPFDVESMRIDGEQGDALEVEEVLTVVTVRKPGKEAYVRVHPDEGYRGSYRILNLKDTREMWLVKRELWPQLVAEPCFVPLLLVTAVTMQGDTFLWPLRIPGPDGRIDEWGRSERAAADLARTSWVRVMAKQGGVGYATVKAKGVQLPEPRWPALNFKELVTIAFRDRVIGEADHPMLRRLRGEV
jgi:hypothetical protein